MHDSLVYETLRRSLPAEPEPGLPGESDPDPRNRDLSIIVLDDDPTGTQTVHGVPVITEWSVEAIAGEFRLKTPVFFILTNSRSLAEESAGSLATRIGLNIREASERVGRDFRIISRSDSTLRGHYPVEMDRLGDAIFKPKSIHVLIPAFIEAGRVTVDGIHYVRENDRLVPVGKTSFASDLAFGFRHSRLADWIGEKTKGGKREADIRHISLACIRQGGVKGILSELAGMEGQSVLIVDAFAYSDLDTVARALRIAEARGMVFLYRTGASFVRSYAGIRAREAWLPLERMGSPAAPPMGGLIVVGSHVPLTSLQLAYLREHAPIHALELNLDPAPGIEAVESQARHIGIQVESLISRGQDAVVYTSRSLVRKGGAAEDLAFGQAVSRLLVGMVSALRVKPGFLIAKGGITSSDIATQALGVRRALVLGQLLPGVPVWSLGPESKFPGMPYFIFPGNVGGETSLLDAYSRLKGRDR